MYAVYCLPHPWWWCDVGSLNLWRRPQWALTGWRCPHTPVPPVGRSPSVAGSVSCPAHPSRAPGKEGAFGNIFLNSTSQNDSKDGSYWAVQGLPCSRAMGQTGNSQGREPFDIPGKYLVSCPDSNHKRRGSGDTCKTPTDCLIRIWKWTMKIIFKAAFTTEIMQ